MNILVTGGAGYIGSHSTDSLIKAGNKVFVIDDFSNGHQSMVPKDAKVIEGKIHDENLVHKILVDEKIEGVVHFAAFTNVAESIQNPLKYYDNNFSGTVHLLNGIKNSFVKYFVFSSTAAVYKDPGFEQVSELSITDPLSSYGRSKLMSEKIIQDSAESLNLKYVILRYFNVAGASLDGLRGQFGNKGSSLIKRAALAACGKINEIQVYGNTYPTIDGTGVRDYIHVQDLADLHTLALRHLIQGGTPDLLNCGYGHGNSVLEVINTMKQVSGKDFKVSFFERRPGDLAQVVANCDKLFKLFNWQPKYDDLSLICKTAFEWECSSLRAAR